MTGARPGPPDPEAPAVTTRPDPLEQNSLLRKFAVVALLAAALMLSCFQITNLDLGGHLTVGGEVLRTRAIPDAEFFSHTAVGHPYPVHQWLGEVVLFSVEYLFGDHGLVLLRMALVFLGALLLYRNVRREGAPVVVACALVLMLLVAMRPRFYVRPFLVTLVFLPLLAHWIAELREGRTRRLWPILPLMAIWGHIHSGVLFGVLFLLGTFVGEGLKLAWSRRHPKDRPLPGAHQWPGAALDGWNYRRLLGFGAGGIALPFATMLLVNPSGLKPLILPFLFFRNTNFTSMISEYRGVDLLRDWPFDLVAGAVLLGIVLRPKRVDLSQLLVTLGFGILAYQAVRGILPFGVAAAPLLGRTWGAVAADLFARVSRGRGKPGAREARANAAEATTILLLAVAVVVVSVQAVRGFTGFPFGFGRDPKHYPERALDFLWTQNVRGPIFNTDVWASSLLWRGRGKRFPVFVDARLEAYPESFWKASYYRVLQAVPGWEGVLDQYDVRCALLRRLPHQVDDGIGRTLWEHPDWGLAYWDDYALIYVKRASGSWRNDEVLKAWEFTSFNPRQPEDVRDLPADALPRAEIELARLLDWDPEGFLTRWTYAAVLISLHRAHEAAEILGELGERREARDNAPFLRSWAAAALADGDRATWAKLRRQVGDDPDAPDVLFSAAAFLFGQERWAESAALYADVAAADPGDTDALNNRALALARAGDTDEASRLIAEALRRAPGDPYYIATRGEVAFHSGDRAGALVDFQAALDGLPENDALARDEIMHWILKVE